MTLAEVAEVTGGRLADGAPPDALVDGPTVIDSRRVEPGSLFVCIKGEQLDGHDFARQAVADGAVAAVSARPVGVPSVVVDDPQTALGRLAHEVVESVTAAAGCRVVGVTGSSGKTSTKDLLAQVFAASGATVAPEGSLNNELGLPLTVLRVESDTRTLVLEYSTRGPGHIAYLCGIARPDVAIVLNVGAAHLGEFGSREGIASAKGELVEAVSADGAVVLNADDPLVAAMATRAKAAVLTFGASASADVRVEDLRVDALARPRFRLSTPWGEAEAALELHGVHQAFNAAAVVASALAVGRPLDEIVDALSHARTISPHRMQLRERTDGLVVVDDAYNANPDSVRAALQALVDLGRDHHRRTWAVLGPMRELGADSPLLHAASGRDAAAVGVDEVVAVGPVAAPIAEAAAATPGFAGRAHMVADVDAACALLRAEVRSDDVVLVKASNAERFWRVADALLDEAPAEVAG